MYCNKHPLYRLRKIYTITTKYSQQISRKQNVIVKWLTTNSFVKTDLQQEPLTISTNITGNYNKMFLWPLRTQILLQIDLQQKSPLISTKKEIVATKNYIFAGIEQMVNN
jgi:hypothetical protein